MPIKGLTDRDEGFGSGLPLIARVFKGAERSADDLAKNRPGKDLNYFRVEFEPGYTELAPLWEDMYGKEPTCFSNLFLCGDTVDEAFPTWREDWNASQTLLHKCDGETQVRWWNGEMYSQAAIGCAVKRGKDGEIVHQGCNCKQVGRLAIALPEFIEESGILGQFLVVTHSINDILTVYRYLKMIERMVGRVSSIPFTLGRSTQEVSAPKQQRGKDGEYHVNGRIKVNKSLFYLHTDAEYMRSVLLPEMVKPALPAPPVRTISVDPTKTLGTSDRPRILGRDNRDNVISIPATTPQTSGSSALQPQPEPTPEPAPEPKQTGDWATPENLDILFKTAREKIGDEHLTDRELASLVGIKDTDVRSKIMWDAEFLRGAIALETIVTAWNNPLANVTPAKTSAIVTRCMYHVNNGGKTRVSHFVFDVEGLAKQPRVYSRENMKKLVPIEYYEANHFENMHELANTWYEIAKLQIEWHQQGSIDPITSEDHTYLVVTGATPVIEKVETPAEPAPVSVVVDTSTGEIGFVSAPPPAIDGTF